MATWYCGRPRHLVRNKECDPHHSVLGLISLVDTAGSEVNPCELDSRQRAVRDAVRINRMMCENEELLGLRCVDVVVTEGDGDGRK